MVFVYSKFDYDGFLLNFPTTKKLVLTKIKGELTQTKNEEPTKSLKNNIGLILLRASKFV